MGSLRVVVGAGIGIGIVIGLATPTIPAAADDTPIGAVRATALINQSTVQVLAFGCNLERRDGTAVAIRSAGLVTNRHVAGGTRQVDVAADNLPTTVAGAVTAAATADVALVADPAVSLPGLDLAPSDPRPGTAMWVAGFPGVAPDVRPPGLVIARVQVVDYVTEGEPGHVMRLSGGVRPGMSGGPVLDPAGHVAGLVFGNEEPSGDALAIPASRLRKLLSTPGAFVPGSC